MDWYKVEWQGAYPVDTAHTKSGASGYGIYAMFEMSGKTPKLLYIGETYRQSFGTRLKQHQKQWLFRVNGKVVIHYGKIIPPEGKRISSKIVFDIEGLLIHVLVPPYNTVSKHGYYGREIIVFNTGKIGTLPRMLGNKEFVTFLKENMTMKK
jgi:hypothetical protein